MARRHHHTSGDWTSVAARLDEIVAASCGEHAFDALFQLVLGRLVAELDGDDAPLADLLARAQARWPSIEAGVVPLLDPATAARCRDVLDGASLLESGLMGLDALFEGLNSRQSKGAKGQFFTPRHVVHQALAMLDPQPGESLCDPACGSGAFLVHACLQQPDARVVGVDLDPRAARTARVMLAALGRDPDAVQRADSLGSADGEGTFDVVATNPPFAGDVADRYDGSFALAAGRRVERDVLFLERSLRLLKPGGRLAIVLPQNKLGAKRWAFVRRWLLCRMEPLAVVGLGRSTFLPHTSQKACLFVGRRRPEALAEPPPDERVLLFVSRRAGKDGAGRLLLRDTAADAPLWQAVDHDLAEATALLRAPATHPSATRRSLSELDAGFVLAPERYDPRRVLASTSSTRIGDVVEASRALYRPAEATRPVLVLDTTHALQGFVRLGHAPVAPTEVGSSKRQLQPGDLIVSRLRPYLQQIALVDAALFGRDPVGNDVACSTEFYVLRARGGSAAWLLPWLLGEAVQAALAAAQEGGHHPRVRLEALLDLPVPARLMAQREAVAAAVQAQVEGARAAGEGLAALAKQDWRRGGP